MDIFGWCMPMMSLDFWQIMYISKAILKAFYHVSKSLAIWILITNIFDSNSAIDEEHVLTHQVLYLLWKQSRHGLEVSWVDYGSIKLRYAMIVNFEYVLYSHFLNQIHFSIWGEMLLKGMFVITRTCSVFLKCNLVESGLGRSP